MVSYILRRLLLIPFTLIGITIMVFLIARFAPGRPGQLQAPDGQVDAETQKALQDWYEKRYGLNLPLHEQYIRWWRGLVTTEIQAAAWLGDDQLEQVFTLRRTVSEYYVKLDNGSWMQVVSPVYQPRHWEVDDPEFLAQIRSSDLDGQLPKLDDYATPTHLLAECELFKIESLDDDVDEERLVRASNLNEVTIQMDAPAWTDRGEVLYVNPDDPEKPLFQRDGAWLALVLSGSLETAEVKPVGDASVAARMGGAFSDLPQEEDGYATPHHAFLFGIPEQVSTQHDLASLTRLTIPTTVGSPSGVWVKLPGTETRGMLWQQDDAQPVLLVRRGEDGWSRVIARSRATEIDYDLYKQTDESLRSRFSTDDKSQYSTEIDEKEPRVPRHTVLDGTVVEYPGRVTEREVRRFFQKARIFEITLGESIQSGRTVMAELKDRLPVTLLVNFIAFPLIYMLAIPCGMLMAIKRGKRFDAGANIVLLGLWSIPTVLSATLLIGYMSKGGAWIEWFPNNGLSSPGSEAWAFIGYFDDAGTWVPGWLGDRIWHLILPVFCITYGALAYLAKQMRAAMLDNFTMDYVRTAKAKGVRYKDVVFKHVLRNSLLPLITIFATLLPALIAGSIIIEKIFGIEGMGQMTFTAVESRDYDVVQSLALIAGTLNLTGLLLADICYALADPRITYK